VHGCIDLDISALPFITTLPIRRLRLAPDEMRSTRSLMWLSRMWQWQPPEALASFCAVELAVEGDGIVADRSGRYRRVRGGRPGAAAMRRSL
jgi:hypothetical protein